MFNKEDFITRYIETLKAEDCNEAALTKVTATLPQDAASEFYTGIVQELIFALNKEDGDFSEEIKRLENTAALMSFMSELAEEDSNTEETKDESKVEEGAEDAPAASVAAEAPVAEAESVAPAEEAKAEKTEQ